MDRDLRTGQVAVALGLAPATIQLYARNGLIPSRQTPGGQYRFALAEVREALGATELADLTVRGTEQVGKGLVNIVDGSTTIAVDDLSGFRPDPVTLEVETRLRVRAARATGRTRSTWTPVPTSGAAQLGDLLERSGGAAVAVLHR